MTPKAADPRGPSTCILRWSTWPGTEAVAVLGKRRIEGRLQDLQDRLLEQPIQGGRNAKLSHSATRFRNLHPFDRVWAVRAGSQLSFDLRPVFLHVRLELSDGHPVHAPRLERIPQYARFRFCGSRTSSINETSFTESSEFLAVASGSVPSPESLGASPRFSFRKGQL